MAVPNKQQLIEIIHVADISVRVASQLRLARQGHKLLDHEALENANEFLEAAISGGRFMSTGLTGGLQSSLRPLNWAADVRFSSPAAGTAPMDPKQYDELVRFLTDVKSDLALAMSGDALKQQDLDNAITFFTVLGENLGTRADQRMRQVSGVFSGTPLAKVGE